MDQSSPPVVNQNPLTARVQGHFGELVQGRLGARGPVALVTLPCPALETVVKFTPGGPLRIEGRDTEMALDLARQVLAEWAPGTGGLLEVDRPMAPGVGAGSSTADLLGVLRVLARWTGQSLCTADEAQWCHAVEGAVDPLMHPGHVLFASREPKVLEILPPMPAMQVVGGFAGPGLDTDPADQDFPDMENALDLLRAGMRKGDTAMVAEAAHISAQANQIRNPNPAWEGVLTICREICALGPVVSHTGSAIGMILSDTADPTPAMARLREVGLESVIAFRPAPPPPR